MNTQLDTSTAATAESWHRWKELLLGFVCVFGGLSLPLPGLARSWVWAHAALGKALLPSTLSTGASLDFDTTLPQISAWSLTLVVQPLSAASAITVPIDLRSLSYLPTACYVALALATPLKSRRHTLKLLGVGLLILEPLLLASLALPVLSLLSSAGPAHTVDLGLATRTVVEILYRALVASPGMAYAIPLFLWWTVVVRFGWAT